jgi:hypothetical protein
MLVIEVTTEVWLGLAEAPQTILFTHCTIQTMCSQSVEVTM